MVRDIMDWKKELLLRRTMLRHNPPGGVSTGIHYDKLFMRDGDAFFLTAWVPLGDSSILPAEMRRRHAADSRTQATLPRTVAG